MTFSFTHESIANEILLKELDGVKVRGVMEARQVSKYSQFERFGEEVVKDTNKNNMHHKTWIIDNRTVITGSFNPSNNGDKRNDENVIVIKDKKIALKYLEEFERVYPIQT